VSAAIAFGPTADPDAYVPWSGSERALGALLAWSGAPNTPFCLLGAGPGMGKSLLLKLLATRAQRRSVYLGYPACDRAGLAAALLEGLGLPATDPTTEAVAAALRGAAGPPVLLLIDEGELLDADALAWLRETVAGAAGRLRVAIAVTRDERRAEIAALLGDDVRHVAIEGSMTRAEVAAYVRSQLARAAIDPRAAARFDHATLARLHARSEGVPAALQSLAAALLFEAQRASGEIRVPPPRAARAADAAEPAARLEPAKPSPPPARPAVRSRGGRFAVFGLGAALGIAAGFGLADLLRRPALHEAPPAISGASSDALPAVSAAPAAPAADAASAIPAAARPVPDVAASAPPAQVAVSFNADPWAYIEVDGDPIGATPIAEHPVAPGHHRIVASLPDGRVVEREVEIDDGGSHHIVFP